MTRSLPIFCAAAAFTALLGGVAFAGSVDFSPSLKGADLELAKKVKTSLDAKLKSCQSCQIKVDVKDGVVDLSGQITPEQAQAIKDLGVPGVKSVKSGGVKTLAGTEITTKGGAKVSPGMPAGGKTAHEKTIEAVSTHVAKEGAERKDGGSMPGAPPKK